MYFHPRRSAIGFTLVELLVVVLIISILLTVGAVAIRGTGGQNVTSAVASTEAIFDEARAVAVGRGTRARVLIDVDDPQSESYLRRIVIAYPQVNDDEEEEEEPGSVSWELASQGFTLPNSVYFSELFSHRDHENESGDLEEMTLTGVSGLYNGDYLYYEFNAEGICTTGLSSTGSEGYTGPSFVIGRGRRPAGAERPLTTSEGRRDFGGFVIWRNGTTSVFRDPAQIIGNDDPQEF